MAPVNSPANRKRFNLKGHLHDWSHDTMTRGSQVLAAMKKIYLETNTMTQYYDAEDVFDLKPSLFRMRAVKVVYLREALAKAIIRGDAQAKIEEAWDRLESAVLKLDTCKE